MTPDEVELLQEAGRVFISNISVVVTQSVLYGLYLAVFAFGIRALLKRNAWTRSTWILFSFLSVLCLIFTANVAMTVAFNIDLIRGRLIDNPEMPLSDRFQLANDLSARFGNAQTWLGGGSGGGFLFIFADAVVVWRACALWPGTKMVRVFLLALLFISFGCAVVSSTLESISFAASEVVPTSSPTGIMMALSQSLSLATNVVATMLIGYKAYYHRQMIKTSVGMRSSKSGAILLFLTESGVAFCILQIIALATNAADNDPFTPLDYTAVLWGQITLFAAVAYPVLFLLIVDNHRSISDYTGSFTADSVFAQGSHGVVSHLSFAAPPRSNSPSGGGVGVESLVDSRANPTASADHSNEGSVQVQDLEKGEGLPTDGSALSA